jgi:hypothetical protein
VQVTPPDPGPDAAELQQQLSELEDLTPASFAQRYPTAFEPTPHYELADVAGLDLIQASTLRLNPAELALLEKNGFAISSQHWMPTHSYGYSNIYVEDLPVYITADSVLDAVHRSYDSMLEQLEQQELITQLDALLSGMSQNLADGSGAIADDVVADADLYLTVARSLLTDKAVKPLVSANTKPVQELVAQAQSAEGTADIELFGLTRQDEDFSQFTPRGHYTDSPELTSYFRAMIWLGRVDFRLLETQEDGSQLFRRRQLESAVALRSLMKGALEDSFARIDGVIGAFVGESDYMTVPNLDDFLGKLKVSEPNELSSFSDEQLAQSLSEGNYGIQRISSHIMIAGPHSGSLPLSRSFALFGQRYVLDSHVFSNVVYDRINGDPGNLRLMPNPLDVGFAALGNDHAGALLHDELASFDVAGYPTALAQMRTLADGHGADYWKGSLYTAWLGALRQLSPASIADHADTDSLFPVARTEAWSRRLLGTQLSSWAELRHDTILYAKQSYSSGAACNFPDAYVDPYPGFFSALSTYAARGKQLASALELTNAQLNAKIASYFELLADVSEMLRSIAENERAGAELTPEMLAFINDAVKVGFSCVSDAPVETGWYKKLFFDLADSANMKPTIADVHTQPTDQNGAMVGRVLHVGTTAPQEMVVIAEGCTGARAYVGFTTSYRERITDNFERLDDEAWEGSWFQEPEVPWMSDLVAPRQ